jgi:hypothetical protein
MRNHVKFVVLAATAGVALLWFIFQDSAARASQTNLTLSAPFTRRILAPTEEAPFDLRFFITAVKTDSRGRIITGPTSDPVKNIVGAERAGVRAGHERFTKIMYGAAYIDGRPDPGTRIDPNHPVVKSGRAIWPSA